MSNRLLFAASGLITDLLIIDLFTRHESRCSPGNGPLPAVH